MNKAMLSIMIIGFWLLFPIPMMWLNADAYDNTIKNSINDFTVNSNLDEDKDSNFLDSIGNFFGKIWLLIKVIWNLAGLYFTIIVAFIPNANVYINFFLLFMKMVSVIVVFLMLRGD